MSRADYFDLVNTAEKYVEELRPKRQDQTKLDQALKLLKEVRFAATFNPGFREQSEQELQTLVDEMYLELYADD